MGHFPDQLHLERIRHALWKNREFGRASVMVGAGFSQNAVPLSPSVPQMPTWGELSKRFVDALYPPGAASSEERDHVIQQAASTSGALRLAEEYQATFGRDALDSFLISAIPEKGYEPGRLHRLLLSLPWADVLTTNYDTLLERAGDTISERKYDTVRTAADIPSASKPRIVKLHGSFPSTRPFIVTEEDFRTYPRRFAPFVNLAQQIAMETVLCLLGFSGDDPNFLYWTGWVRDHLGPASPQIYLCGILNLNSARRNLLHDRNVAPVDLSPLFPAEAYADRALRHARATEWLLLNLEAGQPPSELWWPESIGPQRSVPCPRLPVIVEPARARLAEEPRFERGKLSTQEQTRSLLTVWRANRKLYPGWIVLPRSNREALWHNTEHWVGALGPKLSDLPLSDRIEFLFELAWRIDRCELPLTDEIANAVRTTLEDVNPFPGLLDLPSATLVLSSETETTIDWHSARKAWIFLACALLRSAREDGNRDSFTLWQSRLTKLATEDPEVISRLHYERSLFLMGELDHEGVLAIVRDWQTLDVDPFWAIRRAAILTEIGEVEEANREADSALLAIRSRIRPETDDFAMLSREGWAMLLVHGLKFAEWQGDAGTRPDFRGRWERLTELRCNPNPDIDFLESELTQPPPPPRDAFSDSIGADGTLRRTYHFSAGPSEGVIAAYQALRLVEDVGYPPQCGDLSLSGKLVIKAFPWLRAHSPHIAVSYLLRTADTDVLQSHFTVQRIALLASTTISDLRHIVERAADSAVRTLVGPDTLTPIRRSIARNRLSVALQVLIPLCLRFEDEDASRALGRTINLYRLPAMDVVLPLST